MSDFSLKGIRAASFRPTAEAHTILGTRLRKLFTGHKHEAARVAIGRSIDQGGEVPLVSKGTEMGKAISGELLFQGDEALWACAVSEAHGVPVESLDQFRHLVEAHWHRGARLLLDEFEGLSSDSHATALALAERLDSRRPGSHDLHDGGASRTSREGTLSSGGGVRVRIGEVGTDAVSRHPIHVTVNAAGASPHFAFMGKTRSGKTRTGLHVAEQIAGQSLPLLVIDPKGEFVQNGSFVAKTEWGGKTLGDRIPGLRPIDVPHVPIPLDMLGLASDAGRAVQAQAAMEFRDSLQKCLSHRGDVMFDQLRQAVDDLLQARNGPVTLERIRDELRSRANSGSRNLSVVDAKLNELTALPLFDARMPPAAFFGERWVIGLGKAPDEARRLVVFLVLDALQRYLLGQADASTDASGHRALRHLLAIDEAKEILGYKHGALSRLLRQGAAKGAVVMLLAQSPEDFDREEDDFLQQVGTIVVFASNAKTMKSLAGAFGERLRATAFSDANLPVGHAMVKVPHQPLTSVLAWKPTTAS